MGNGRDITDERNLETGGVDSAQGGFTAGARSLHIHANGTHAVFLSAAGGVFSRNLSSKGSGLAGTLESALAGGGPAHGVAASIGEGNDSIIERSRDVGDAQRIFFFSFFLTARLALAILHFLGAMVSRSAEVWLHQIQLPTSFYPHCHDADPCGYERSCEYADHGRADHGGAAGHGSSQYPSDA